MAPSAVGKPVHIIMLHPASDWTVGQSICKLAGYLGANAISHAVISDHLIVLCCNGEFDLLLHFQLTVYGAIFCAMLVHL